MKYTMVFGLPQDVQLAHRCLDDHGRGGQGLTPILAVLLAALPSALALHGRIFVDDHGRVGREPASEGQRAQRILALHSNGEVNLERACSLDPFFMLWICSP